MSDKNWEAELAKIDKQLASVSDEQLLADKRAAAGRQGDRGVQPGSAVPAPQSSNAGAYKAGGSNAAGRPAGGGSWRGWVQTAVAAAAATGLLLWPWNASCGLPLYGLVAASGATVLIAIWSAIGSWRHRLGFAHIVSLLIVVWASVIGARELLPRVGYAIPSAERGAFWECGVQPLPQGIPLPSAPSGGPGASL